MESQRALTASERVGRMLIVAAIVVPVLCTAAVAVTKRFLWVHYTSHTVMLWLALDAAVLIAGVILHGEQHT